MRALLIGGTRFIGAHVARRLVAQGAAVTVFHRGRSSNPILPAAVHHVCDASAEYPVERFPEAIVRADWDLVVHMVMMGEADGLAATRTFSGRAGRLVMISSGDVYRAYGRLTGLEPGEPDSVPLAEDAPLRSLFHPYRKFAGQLGAYARDYEKIHAERAVVESGIPFTILRLPKVYGPEDNADLSTVYNFVDHPDWRWTHGHVENVAHAVVLGATQTAAAARIYNVGEAETPTTAQRLARLPVRAPTAKAPPFDYRQDMVMSSARLRRELGYVDVVDEADAMLALAGRQGELA
jgi:nucleoside-diphosphate-sugar epimerase